MTKDYQKQRVYNWESQMSEYHKLDLPELTTKECQRFACKIWNKYKNNFTHHFSKHLYYCSLVKIKKVRGYTSSMSSGLYSNNKRTKSGKPIFYRRMKLSKYGHNKKTVLHEMAHALAPRRSHHDAKFVGIVVYLYAKYLNYNFKYMVKTLNEANIHFSFNFSKSLNRRIKAIQKDRLTIPSSQGFINSTVGISSCLSRS